MLQACGHPSDQPGRLVGEKGVLLGVRARWAFNVVPPSMMLPWQLLPTPTNLKALKAEGERSLGRSSASTAELIGQS